MRWTVELDANNNYRATVQDEGREWTVASWSPGKALRLARKAMRQELSHSRKAHTSRKAV